MPRQTTELKLDFFKSFFNLTSSGIVSLATVSLLATLLAEIKKI